MKRLLIILLTYCLYSIEFVQCTNLQIIPFKGTIINGVYNIAANSNLKLSCRFIPQNDTVETCSVQWKVPQKSQNRIKLYPNKNEATIRIHPVRTIDTGPYMCVCTELSTQSTVLVTVVINHNQCGDAFFVCNAGNCIAKRYVCDGKQDCRSGEDEDLNQCGPDPCLDKISNCIDGRCIPKSWCCDPDVSPNCTVKEKPSCCDPKYTFLHVEELDQDIKREPTYLPRSSIGDILLKSAILLLFVGGFIFFFGITFCGICCHLRHEACPLNDPSRLDTFYFNLNRRNGCYVANREMRRSNASRPANRYPATNNRLLCDRYLNDNTRCNMLLLTENERLATINPPPPYTSRENLATDTSTQPINNENQTPNRY